MTLGFYYFFIPVSFWAMFPPLKRQELCLEIWNIYFVNGIIIFFYVFFLTSTSFCTISTNLIHYMTYIYLLSVQGSQIWEHICHLPFTRSNSFYMQPRQHSGELDLFSWYLKLLRQNL